MVSTKCAGFQALFSLLLIPKRIYNMTNLRELSQPQESFYQILEKSRKVIEESRKERKKKKKKRKKRKKIERKK